MPPKPTRPPERMELPGGFWLEKTGEIWWLCANNWFGVSQKRQVCDLEDSDAQAFADAMREAVDEKLMQLASPLYKRGQTINPDSTELGIKEAVAALQSPAGEWRDISTAPKNGDEILVARLYDDGGALMEVACWYVASWAKRSTESLAIATQGKVSMILLIGEEAPTHWLPLPPAPTGKVK